MSDDLIGKPRFSVGKQGRKERHSANKLKSHIRRDAIYHPHTHTANIFGTLLERDCLSFKVQVHDGREGLSSLVNEQKINTALLSLMVIEVKESNDEGVDDDDDDDDNHDTDSCSFLFHCKGFTSSSIEIVSLFSPPLPPFTDLPPVCSFVFFEMFMI